MKFKTSTLNPSLCDFSDACIFVSGAITVVGGNADDAGRVVDRNRNDKKKKYLKIVHLSSTASLK